MMPKKSSSIHKTKQFDKSSPIGKLIAAMSFGVLDKNARDSIESLDFVRSFVQNLNCADEFDAQLSQQLQNFHLFECRKTLQQSADDCSADLENMISATFQFSPQALRQTYEQQLLFSFVVFSAQYQAIKKRIVPTISYKNDLERYRIKVNRCIELLGYLEEANLAAEFAEIAPSIKQKYRTVDDYIDEKGRYSKVDHDDSTPKPTPENKWSYQRWMIYFRDKDKWTYQSWMHYFSYKNWERYFEDSFNQFMAKLSEMNARRLLTVWTQVDLEELFSNMGRFDALGEIAKTRNITGPVSCFLYLFRGGVAFANYLRGRAATVEGLTEAQEKIRKQEHWDAFKYYVWNDWIWGPSNGFGYYNPALSYWADFLTGVLLVMDFALMTKAHFEAEKAHQEMIKSYDESLIILRKKIKAAAGLARFDIENMFEEDEDTEDDLSNLANALDSCYEQEYERYKSKQLEGLHALVLQYRAKYSDKMACEEKRQHSSKPAALTDVAYSFGLMIAFAMLCYCYVPGPDTIPFLPHPGMIPEPYGLIIHLAGVALCLGFTLLHRWKLADIKYKNMEKAALSREEKFDECMKQFLALKKEAEDCTTDIKKFHRIDAHMKRLYLEMLQVGASVDYQQQDVAYEAVKFRRDMFLRLCVPAVFLVTWLFVPDYFWYVFAAGIVLTVAFYKVLEKLYQPEPTNWKNNDGNSLAPAFDNRSYEVFKLRSNVSESKVLLKEIQQGRTSNNLSLFGSEKHTYLPEKSRQHHDNSWSDSDDNSWSDSDEAACLLPGAGNNQHTLFARKNKISKGEEVSMRSSNEDFYNTPTDPRCVLVTDDEYEALINAYNQNL